MTNHLRKKSNAELMPDIQPASNGAPATLELPASAWMSALDHPSHSAGPTDQHWAFMKNASGSLRETLRQVVGCKWKGALYKLDGHVRGDLWRKGAVAAPATVRATIYFPESEREFYDLYQAHHATSSALSRLDEIQAAFRENDLSLNSRRLKHGLLVQAFTLALRGRIKTASDEAPLNLREAVGLFRDELLLLDKAMPSAEIFQTGVVAAALICLTLYPKQEIFFEKLAQEKGNKRDGLLDPVECVLSLVEKIRNQGTASIDAVQEDLCARTVRAFLAHMRGDPEVFEGRVNNTMKRYWFKRMIQGVDLDTYVKRVRRKKKIADKSDM
ncbi:hypothetical protein [Hyphococcus sp.]|uniref:hypothetical protein n=1 Tax=Hyphococcus sp. TaxID=2038636 RepID=UPI0035C6B452